MTAITAHDIGSGLESNVVEHLQDRLRGALLLPGKPGYDEARSIWNAMIGRRPALIARCLGVADVLTCVNFAREHGLRLSVKGGGHNIAGLAVCDGGLMLDMSLMRGVCVDSTARTARAQGRLCAGRRGPRDPTARPRRSARIRLGDGHRGPHAGRRLRIPHAQVGVSHACGHDTHVAAQLGVANLLAGMKPKLTGTVVFIFQPAEEGLPPGETGGAKLMVAEGELANPRPDLIQAFHADGDPPESGRDMELGRVSYTPGDLC